MDQTNEKAFTLLIDHLDVAACVAAIRKRKAGALSDAMASAEAEKVAASVLRLLPKTLETATGPLLTLRFESEHAPSLLLFHRVALLLTAITGTTWRGYPEGLDVNHAALEAALLDRATREKVSSKPSCEECGDSHQMELRGDLVPCTRCLIPVPYAVPSEAGG